MRLFEINSTITFSSGYINPVTKKFTKQFLDAGLYIDDDTRLFKNWWSDPEEEFENGAVFSIAYHNDNVVGVGVIEVPSKDRIYKLRSKLEGSQGVKYGFFGIVGFFVQEQYRRSGVSNTLARLLEDTTLNSFPKYRVEDWVPVVYCSRMACDIVDKQFKTIISDKEMSRILDKNNGF